MKLNNPDEFGRMSDRIGSGTHEMFLEDELFDKLRENYYFICPFYSFNYIHLSDYELDRHVHLFVNDGEFGTEYNDNEIPFSDEELSLFSDICFGLISRYALTGRLIK